MPMSVEDRPKYVRMRKGEKSEGTCQVWKQGSKRGIALDSVCWGHSSPSMCLCRVGPYRHRPHLKKRYKQELKNNGYEAVSIPVLSFTFVNSDQLKTHLQNLSDFSAIILTSPRAVEAVVKASEAIADKGKKFGDMKCYVVGKATGVLAKKAGFTTTGEDSGSATGLAKVISAGPSQDGKPFLYPCSDIRRDVLVQHLKEKDLAVEEITVYNTNPNDALESSVKGVLHNQGLPEFAVFFSPSGVQYTEPLVKKGLLPLDKIKVIALGPATKLEVEARGVTLHGVTAKPEPTSLVTLLKQEQVEEQKD